MKVCLITNMIPPYRLPIFEAIGKSVELTVVMSSRSEPNRQWPPWDDSQARNFNTIVLKGLSIETDGGVCYVQPGLLKVLGSIDYDVVISTGFNLNSFFAAIHSCLRKKRALLWSEATSNSERNRSRLRTWYRKMLVGMYDGFIPSGKEAWVYLKSLGAMEGKGFTAVDAVAFVDKRSLEDARRRAAELRSQFCGTVFLYAGRVSRAKGSDNLLAAYKRLSDHCEASLVLMGGGELESQLRLEVQRENIRNVHFVGFQNEIDKWVYFLASDVFVFPTVNDVWGLVVNEAMLCGLPVICSPFAGAVSDMVENGVNGFVADPSDIDSLADKMIRLSCDQAMRKQMSAKSLEKIAAYSIDKSADGFLRAIFGKVST